jgi:hypothetical protein
LILLHGPYSGFKRRKCAWKALVEAVEEGKVRSAVVSNYGAHDLEKLDRHIKELVSESSDGGRAKGKGHGILWSFLVELHPWIVREDIVS